MRIIRAGEHIQHIPGISVRESGVAVASNGLLNNLIAYWPGNEESGDLLDAHTNALHLTDTNTVTNASGKVYATARHYTAAAGEYHTRPGDDALLSIGDVDATLAAWVLLDSKGADRAIVSKGDAPYEYILEYGVGDDRWVWIVRNSANSAYGICVGTDAGSPSLSTWYFVVAWHDSVANSLNIQVNNGAVTSLAWSEGVNDSTSCFTVGAFRHWGAPARLMNGRIGPTAMWKSTGGGGGVLTATQRTALYNSGSGLAYAAFTA